MPGREDLIQQNVSRTQPPAQAPTTQKQTEDTSQGSTASVPSHRSVMGGNLDVAEALTSINFIGGPSGDGSMRNSVAYIRKWSRGNTAQSTGSSSSSATPQFYENANNVDFSQMFTEGLSVDGTFTDAAQNADFFRNIDTKYFDSLSSYTPTSSTFAYDANLGIDFNIPPLSQQPTTTTTPATPVKSANPWGVFSRVFSPSRPGNVGYGGSLTQKDGSGRVPEGGSLSQDGSWQFLFNPSEMELIAGPEYKAAETWAVSDKANSGQPLHWTHNKNAELRFSSVLLNGYVFGKKVEQLEQGLFALFMARDGEGQDGPHVLEFVWGKRTFGPCVIKEISVKEKMWDEGEVVNAEVSFTLEQVPEWVINDGFVDVARPGAQPIVADPTPSSTDTQASTTTPTADGTQPPPGGGEKQDQKAPVQNPSQVNSDLYNKCQRAAKFADGFYALEDRYRPPDFKDPKKIQDFYRQVIYDYREKYIRLYEALKRDLGNEVIPLMSYPNSVPVKLIQSTDAAIKFEDNKGFPFNLTNYPGAKSIIKNAANSARLASKSFSDSSQCKSERAKQDKITNQQEADRICKNKNPGSKCSYFNIPPGGRIKSCSGVELICGSDGYLKNASSYTP